MKILEADTTKQIKPDTDACPKIAIAVSADSLATEFGAAACAVAKENSALDVIVDDQDYTLTVLTRGEVIGYVSTTSTPPTGFAAEAIGSIE